MDLEMKDLLQNIFPPDMVTPLEKMSFTYDEARKLTASIASRTDPRKYIVYDKKVFEDAIRAESIRRNALRGK
jgi:hypothetical protein